MKKKLFNDFSSFFKIKYMSHFFGDFFPSPLQKTIYLD